MPLVLLALLLLTACILQPIQRPSVPKQKTNAPTTDNPLLSTKDGVTLIYIPAGPFLMGSTAADTHAQEDEFPQHTVYLDAFWIDQTEVSNARYTRCVEADVCAPIVTPRPDMATQPDFPAQGIAWPQAVNYCEWVGKRLPTEAEWEKAARGERGQLYSWSVPYSHTLQINIDFQIGDINNVGANPDDRSPYGLLDMGGNVAEWVADWYGAEYYTVSPEKNPPGPERGSVRGQRGGAWNVAPKAARVANRFWAFPDRNDFTGFRCALSDKAEIEGGG